MNDRKFRWGIREKLTLLFFGVTLIAVSVNFLMVVPRLERGLRSDRVEAMEQVAQRFNEGFVNAATVSDQQLTAPAIWTDELTRISGTVGNRVAILRSESPTTPFDPSFRVFVDPSGETKEGQPFNDPVAAEAIRTGKISSGLTTFGTTGLHAEAASPLIVNGNPVGAVVYSTSLAGVTEIVKQQARRNIIAGIFALIIALAAGLMASSYMARRLRRLELAAREVAKGNFTEPIVIDAEDEIGSVARAFNTMQDRLGRADRARKAFIANASHELRTPLFSLGGYVELMREEDLDEQTQREFLDVMHDQIHRMTKLATDLLDLSKLDTGSVDIQMEQVDLCKLAQAVAREFDPQAANEESEVTVTVPDDLRVTCDPDRTAQIIRILIDNALHHTPDGTAIEVAAREEAGEILVTVSDNGPGIAPEDINRIFDRFHTGDKTGGTGLGLSIAKEMAMAMDGELTVKSQPGETTFTLRLSAVNPD